MVPDDTLEQVDALKAHIDELDSLLQPLLKASPEDIQQLEPLQRAQVHLALARGASELMRLHLRCKGVDPSDHAVAREADRLALYAKRVSKALAAKELSESRRALSLDVAAASRFIDHAIPDLSAEQRAALRQAGNQHLAKTEAASAAAAAGAARDGKAVAGSTKRKVVDPTGATQAQADAFLDDVLADIGGNGGAAAGSGGGGGVGNSGNSGSKKKKRKS